MKRKRDRYLQMKQVANQFTKNLDWVKITQELKQLRMLISEVKNQRQSVYEYNDRAVDLFDNDEHSKNILKNRAIYDPNKSHQSIEMSDQDQLMKARVKSKNSQKNLWHRVHHQDPEVREPRIFSSTKWLPMSKFKVNRKDTKEIPIRIGKFPSKESESESEDS